jgi:hypothetical protein
MHDGFCSSQSRTGTDRARAMPWNDRHSDSEAKRMKVIHSHQVMIINFNMMHSVGVLALVAALCSLACGESVIGDLSNLDAQKIQLVESDRLREYEKRNYTWPLNNYSPNLPGWKALMEERFAQIAEMEEDRYEGYIQTIHSAFLGESR